MIPGILACVFLVATLLGVWGLSFSPELEITNYIAGILGAFMCAFGWGIEAVILAKCLKDPEITDEYALVIRQGTSARAYGVVILPIIGGFKFTFDLFINFGAIIPTIAAAGLFATISYLFYYKAIASIGAAKATALNVSYSAWAIFFSVVILGDTTGINHVTVICALFVLIGGILTSTDYKKLFNKD